MIKRLLLGVMWLYLMILLLIWGFVHFDSGNSLWVAIYLFSPRWVLGIPWLLLFPLTLIVDWKMSRWYVIHLVILLVPLFGFCIPYFNIGSNLGDTSVGLRLITANVGEGPIRTAQLLALLKQERTDVLLLQECNSELYEELKQKLDWNFRYNGKLVIASPKTIGEIVLVRQRVVDDYNVSVMIVADVSLRADTMAVEVDSVQPSSERSKTANSIRIACVHFPTFRPAFEKSLRFDESASDEYRGVAEEYRGLAKDMSSELRSTELPLVIAGDFNVPVESVFFREYWGEYKNALSRKGLGLCFTKYTRLHGVRIDHVLMDHRWFIHSAKVGPDLGGDHRPVMVELSLLPQQ